MDYVDGFLHAIPNDRIEDYKRIAETCADVWLEYGALEYRECIAEDVKPGKLTSFPRALLLEPNEIVIFAWITYESRAHRDEVMAKVMADPRLKDMSPETMPGDMKRMIFGGFDTLVYRKK